MLTAGKRSRGCIAFASASPRPPYNVVITGGTKGVGKALAEEFVRIGDNVAICSRDEDRVASTIMELKQFRTFDGNNKVCGQRVDVTKASDVSSFADYAFSEMGSIDLWINNAGTNAYTFKPLIHQTEEELASVVQTNLLGILLCCKEAIRVMRQQEVAGHIFNMDGAGANGGATPRFAAYGATKRSLEQLGKSLRAELKSAGITNVGIHNLSPGMVTTELLMAGADNKVSKFFINCLAEEPKTVAETLVPKIRAVPSSQANNILAKTLGTGEYIRFLTNSRAYSQILRRLIIGERKNKFVPED